MRGLTCHVFLRLMMTVPWNTLEVAIAGLVELTLEMRLFTGASREWLGGYAWW